MPNSENLNTETTQVNLGNWVIPNLWISDARTQKNPGKNAGNYSTQ